MNAVFVRLIGGLGNQMFQYSAGRALSVRLGVPLKLDINAFDRYRLRKFELGVFGLEQYVATKEELSCCARAASRFHLPFYLNFSNFDVQYFQFENLLNFMNLHLKLISFH